MKKKKTTKKTEQKEYKPKPKIKYKIGRPTKYEPKFCEWLIEHMSAGFSFESFGAIVSASRATLYDWCELFPEFLDAREKAKELNLNKWETIGNDLSATNKGNASAFIFNMKNRHGWKNDPEINIGVTVNNIADLINDLDED